MRTFSTVPTFTFFYTIDGERWFKRSTKTAQAVPLDSDVKTPCVYFKANKLVTGNDKQEHNK